MLERIRRLYEDYEAEFARLESTRRVGTGMFGLSGGPRDYPCHTQFAEDLEELLKQAADQNISPEQAGEVLEYIYFAPLSRSQGQDAVYWMIVAVHSLTFELIGRLSPEDAARLLTRYQKIYPRRKQFPVQKKVVSALKEREKG